MQKIVLSILVNNTAGVLARISGLFGRRGYNIASLTVGETERPDISRMTVVALGDEQTLVQIGKQLEKLQEVISVKELKPEQPVCSELILLKVRTKTDAKRQSAISIADVFRAKVVDVAVDSLMMQLTGETAKIDAFIKMFYEFEILELVRTGLTGLERA